VKPPGVIVNARARRAGRDPRLAQRLHRHLPEEFVHFTYNADDLSHALEALRALAIEDLVLVGGDGTIGGTLTPLVERWGDEPLPRIAVVAGGTVNTIAHSLGAHAAADQVVERILSERPPREESVRCLVRVEPAEGPTRAGLIFGNGVAARWLELYYKGEDLGPVAAGGLVVRIALSAIAGSDLARTLFEPCGVEITVDGARLDAREFTIAGAASVRDVGLGFRPFLSAGSDPDCFHFLHTSASAARLCAELPALRLGWYGPRSCLRHHRARVVEMRFASPEPWSMDADLYPATDSLRLSAWAQLRFAAY
jgi:diacylglycerol kinase family enzyme